MADPEKESEHKEQLSTRRLVVILMGSESDKSHADKIVATLQEFNIPSVLRIASAHKTPEHALSMLREYEKAASDEHISTICIAVAGRSNALGGFLDANTTLPVIQSPPKGEWFDVFSSLRMPSGIAAPVVIEPEAAALHAIKIFSLADPELARRYQIFQENIQAKIYAADAQLKSASGF